MSPSAKLKRFLRATAPQFAVMLFLAIINVVTTSFPWAIFPIGAMMISVLITAANIFLADDADTAAARHVAPAGSQHAAGHTPGAEIGQRLSQAHAYQRQIEAMANATADPLRKEKLRELSEQVNTWTKAVEEMARRIEAFKRNEVIQRDLTSVPQAIKKLTAQLAQETDPGVRASIERTLATRADQMKSLQQLQNLTRQAEIQLENTIAALGTIYSQALAMQSTNQVADYGHLSAEVDEQSRMLRDQLEALQEVKLGRELSRESANLSP